MEDRKKQAESMNPQPEQQKTAGEARREAVQKRKKTIRKEVILFSIFLVLSAAAVYLAYRVRPGIDPVPDEGNVPVISSDPGEKDDSGTETETEEETETETEEVTEPPTERPTEPPTEPATEPPTEAPTEPPTEPPTQQESSGISIYAYKEMAPGITIPVQSGITMPPWIVQDLLPEGADSRPMAPIGQIRYVCIHYVGNPGSSPKGNRQYFAENRDGRCVSSHFIVGIYGEILQCIPMNEIAYAQGISKTYMDRGMQNRNYDSISIENCHPDWGGQFTDATYQSLVKLSAWLLEQYHLTPDALIRHFDATNGPEFGIHGKSCPRFYVQNPGAWDQFKADVAQYMASNPNIQ